jgi:hypothetical protein
MKSLAPILTLTCAILLPAPLGLAQITTSSGGGTGSTTPPEYSIVDRGPNHRVWRHVTSTAGALGKVSYTTNVYTELASGMHYRDPGTGLWTESQELIEGFPGGAVARRGPIQIIFANDLASAGAIDAQTPSGRFQSHLLCLSYADSALQTNVIIAEVTNCQGEIIAPNQVLYPQAFSDGVDGAVRYTFKRFGWEQDILINDPGTLPTPEACGMDSTSPSLMLQVITEFINPPTPVRTSQSAAAPGTVAADEDVSWGALKLGRGQAVLLGNSTNSVPFPTAKRWYVTPDNRYLLVEEIPFAVFLKQILSLSQGASLDSRAKATRGLASLRDLPKLPTARTTTKLMQYAAVQEPERGFLIDYFTLLSTNNFTFQGDMTYYVSGPLTLSGITIFEGGCVIKVTNLTTAGLSIGTVKCATGPYRPAIFTSKDDDSVGEKISGSTGNPTNFYGTMLKLGSVTTLNDCRFSYASQALSISANLTMTNVQFVKCATPIYGASDPITVTVRNGLFWSNNIVFDHGHSQVFIGEHLTVKQSGSFFSPSGTPDCSIYLTNSLMVGLSQWGRNINDLGTNQVAWLASDVGVFKTVGASGAYLADNSPYRNAGVASIDPGLAASLKLTTTYPPVVLAGPITNDMILTPQAQRNTGIADIGFHYTPIDFAISGLSITNTLWLTNGVVLASYGTAPAMALSGSGQLVSRGFANNLNRLVRYNLVQEQSTTNWSSTTVGDTLALSSPSAKAQCAFTAWSLSGGTGNHINQTNDTTSSWFSHNQFGGGRLSISPGMVAFTNCLWERVSLTLDDQAHNNAWYLYNNLWRGGSLSYRVRGNSSAAIAYDNLFDRTVIGPSGSSASFTSGYNGYVTNCNTLTGSQGNDRVLTNTPVYQTSYLGNYYYPTNDGMLSTLINAGNRWATNASLYHFTTTTNQQIEGVTKIDIGYHSVAIDPGLGLPYDYDGDGIANYLEDTNGDSSSAGDPSDWRAYNSPNGLTLGGGLQVFTPLK